LHLKPDYDGESVPVRQPSLVVEKALSTGIVSKLVWRNAV